MDYRALIGQPWAALTTPALVVDAAVLEANLQRMADYFAGRACKLRPHFKSHKCVTLAQRQLAAGSAVGMTVAKLAEAEVLVAGGVNDVLIANQVVGPAKAARLAALNRAAIVRAAVDSAVNVAELGAAATAAGVTVGVLVEVDLGMKRCGVDPGAPTLALARRAAETPGLRFDGLQGYEGHLVMLADMAERAAKTREAMGVLVEQAAALRAAGLDCALVSGGGTGTYDITGNVAGVTELQAGSYALMDNHYLKRRGEFGCALSVLATIISAHDDVVVADVGLKGQGCDFGAPVVADAPGAEVMYVAEEHTPVRGYRGQVGQRLRLIPSHGCTTCNLHRRMWLVRGEIIEDVWDIEGSGCLE